MASTVNVAFSKKTPCLAHGVRSPLFGYSSPKSVSISLKILINEDSSAIGGKCSFDADNRKKYPKNEYVPKIKPLKFDNYFIEAKKYIKKNFPKNPGEILQNPIS